MIFKITINDIVNKYIGITETVQGINDTLFELSGTRCDNLDVALTELLTVDTFKDILYTTGIIIPGTRLNNEILGVRKQTILSK